MNNYYRCIASQKKTDYVNLILPLLIKFGQEELKMMGLFNNGQVRMRWGRDWNEFTIHLTNPLNEPTWPMDELIHCLWRGMHVPNRLIMTCFLEKEEIGPVSSIAITDLHTLAKGLGRYGKKQQVKNRINAQTFATLPFSHKSLSKNIWGVGIK